MSSQIGLPRPRLVFVLPESDKQYSSDDDSLADVVTRQPEELENSEIVLNVLSDPDCSTDAEGSDGEEEEAQGVAAATLCLPPGYRNLCSDVCLSCTLAGSVTVIIFLLAFYL